MPRLALLAVLAGSSAFHAYRAEHPTTSYQSADERSYGKLAVGIADEHTYGNGLKDPLHWPPGGPMLFAAGGLALGAAVLTRADLLPVPFVLGPLVALWTWRAAGDARRGLVVGAASSAARCWRSRPGASTRPTAPGSSCP